MRSVIQKKSYNFVQVFWLDKDLFREKISTSAKILVSNHPEVQKIVLFGSVVNNRETVTSDVDILLIIDHTEDRFIDRPLKYIDYFGDIEMTVDLFVYTEEEVKQGVPLVKTALKYGRVIFNREDLERVFHMREKREKELTAELQRVIDQLKDIGAKKIILFGSLATGDVSL